MRIPTIDNLMTHIHDSRTKNSMDEVLSCFYANNLRSAVVMLYATVVSDIYYKIKFNTCIANAIDFAINIYGSSLSYNTADTYFENLIEPYLSEMSVNQLTQLIQHSNVNSQIYGRRNAYYASNRIKKAMDSKNPCFDYTQYQNFK